MPQRRKRRLRVVTYNILLGGERREQRILGVLRRSGADVIVLQEVRDRGFVDSLAGALGMTAVIGASNAASDLKLALLSRPPIVSHRTHRHASMLRGHLEVVVEPSGRDPLRFNAVHLAARFGERAKGEARRLRELGAVLEDIRRAPDMPHLLLGDFNALTPGDHLEATGFFRRMAELRRARLLVRHGDGMVGPPRADQVEESVDSAWLAAGIDPHLYAGIPTLPRAVGPLTALLPRSRRLDTFMGRMIERWTIPRVLDRGYVDCFRRVHPRAHGYTCATWLPAARIDYIFATPDLGRRLLLCEVVGGRAVPDAEAAIASDHFPLVADFAI